MNNQIPTDLDGSEKQKKSPDLLVKDVKSDESKILINKLKNSSLQGNDIIWLEEVDKIVNKDVIKRPNCKFCNHPARHDAEEIWEKYKRYTSIKKFFDEYNVQYPDVETLSEQNITRHIKNHYEKQMSNMWLTEYCQELRERMQKRINKENMYEILLNSMFHKYLEIISDPCIDSLKQADTCAKIMKTITDVGKAQSELENHNYIIKSMFQKFTNLWVDLISKESDRNKQKEYLEQLETFRQEFGDIIVEE